MVEGHRLYSFCPLAFVVLWGQDTVNFGQKSMDVGTYYVFLLIWCFTYYQVSHTCRKCCLNLHLLIFWSDFPFYYRERAAEIIHYGLCTSFCFGNYHFIYFDGMCLIIYNFRVSSSCVLKL